MIYLLIKNNKKKLFRNFKSGGFTLVEILVSISLLAVIILGVNRIYVSINDNQAIINDEINIQSDMEYFFKIASNNIKSADISDGTSCSVVTTNKFFLLEPDVNNFDKITFTKNGACFGFYATTTDGIGNIYLFDESASVDQAITSSNTNVLDLSFSVEDNVSTGQPIVTILVKVAPKSDSSNFVYIQNSISLNTEF
ncbi:MAG TPA: prepilin-type N-terminal cleavage/methylation domain-containing protein [bacterium]|nr:prepilin-type N-terminal cleavage/methylation domain-containing protein [bacterium]